jgi:trimeric autotransporter adhesin
LVIGVDTKFATELREGDWIVIPEFKPATVNGYQKQWLVSEVQDDQTLVVIARNDDSSLPANVSAFLVAPAMIAVMQSNGLVTDTPPPPAILVVNNRQDMSQSSDDAPNTVAINLPLQDIDYKYALQVDGPVNFHGGGTFDDITADTITVKKWLKIAGAGDGGNVLAAGPASGSLLTVTQTNVVIGTSKGTSLLEIGGDAHAIGNLAAGGQLQGATAKIDGLAEAGALSVKGVQVGSDGSVTMLAPRVAIPISTTQPGANGKANTDGMIVVQLSPNGDLFYGLVTVTTKLKGANTSQNTLTAAASQITTFKKDGTKDSIYYVPQNSSMCVPVCKDEDWAIALTGDGRVNVANVAAYWIPFGPQASPPSVEAMPVPNASGSQLLRQVWGSSADAMPFSRSASQEEIDRRVAELTRSVGNALHLPAEGGVREAFVERLQKLVCSAAPPGERPENRVDAKDIDSLVDFLGKATGHAFAPLERELLDKGIRALIAINDSDANRNDPALIRRNILMFMQYAQKAMGVTLSQEQAREMIRALVRIVGTGMHDPFKEQGDAST